METFFLQRNTKESILEKKNVFFFCQYKDCTTLVKNHSASLFFLQQLLGLFCLLKSCDTPNNNKEIAATKADYVQGFSRVKNYLWWWLTNTVIQTHSTKYPTFVQCVPNTDKKPKINSKKVCHILLTCGQALATLYFVLNVL